MLGVQATLLESYNFVIVTSLPYDKNIYNYNIVSWEIYYIKIFCNKRGVKILNSSLHQNASFVSF